MRKYVFPAAIALLVLGVLVACGPSETAQDGTEGGAATTEADQGVAAGEEATTVEPTTEGETAQAGEVTPETGEAPAAGAAAVAFTDLDTDQSGALNQGEFDGAIDRIGLVQSWDTDANGTISQEEFTAAQSSGQLGVQEGGADAAFTQWDANGDGNLDGGELRAGMYAQVDGDGDGQVTEAEWSQANLMPAGQS